MRNSLFVGVIVASILVLTAALAFVMINHDSGLSVAGNDNSLGNTYWNGPTLDTMKTSDLVMITNDKGSEDHMDMTVYRPAKVDEGWYTIGDLVEPSYYGPKGQVTLVRVNGTDDPDCPMLAAPLSWRLVWADYGSGAYLDTSIWRPIAPDGYVALGCVVVEGYNPPVLPEFRCVRADLVTSGIERNVIWNDRGGRARYDVSLWSITPADASGLDASTFWAHGDYSQHPEQAVYCLKKTIVNG